MPTLTAQGGTLTAQGGFAAYTEPLTGGAKVSAPSAGRLLIGAVVDTSTGLSGESGIESRETDTGRLYDMHLRYYNWGDAFDFSAGSQVGQDVAHGRIPQVSWGYNTLVLSQVNDGSHDAYIAAQAVACKRLQHPMFLRFGIEMNSAGMPYTQDPTNYIAAYQRAKDIFDAHGATNVSWVWCPNIDSKGGVYTWENYYPGDAYADWIGVDGYNNTATDPWRSFSTIFGPFFAYAKSTHPSKPVMIGEMSCAPHAGNSKGDWIRDLTGWLLVNADWYNIKALSWFDTNTSTSGIDYRVDSDADSYAAWKVFAGYVLTGGSTANPAPSGTTVVSDSFNRADGAVGNAETGQAWTATGYAIAGNELGSTGTGVVYAFLDSGHADATIEATCESSTGAAIAEGVLFRYSSTTQHFFFRNSTGQLFQANAGAATSVATFATGSVYRDRVKIVCAGTAITIYRNGVQIGTWTDPGNSANTKHGFRTATNALARYDDFRVAA